MCPEKAKKMKNLLMTTALASVMMASVALAEGTLMLGLSMNFGAGKDTSLGVTAKVLSDNKRNSLVGAAGVSYFFENGGYFGADAGLGYTFSRGAAVLSYDFLNKRPQLSAGWADIC
jgi:hypothetical protein